jgi:hypothetical protein
MAKSFLDMLVDSNTGKLTNTSSSGNTKMEIPYGGPYSAENYNAANQVLQTGMPTTTNNTPLTFQQKWFGGKENVGMFTGGAQALSGLASAWAGLEGVKLGKRNLDFQKQAYNTNITNQTQLANQGLEDKYRRTVAAAGQDAATKNYGTLEEYMAKNRLNSKTV